MAISTELKPTKTPFRNGLDFTKINEKFALKATILSGRHKGALILFPSDRKDIITIGTSTENDIVLLGAEINHNHFSVKPGTFIDNQIIVIPNNGLVELEDGQIVDIGQKVNLSLPAILKFGDSSILFEREYDIKKVGDKIIKPALIVIFSILIGLIGSSFIAKQNYFYSITSSSNSRLETTIDKTAADIAQLTEKRDKTASLIRQYIAKMELDNFLVVQENPDGTVAVSGVLPEGSMPAWRTILQWYDGQPNLSYMVNNVTSRKEGDFELSIKSVWIDGDARLVVLSDGTMARIGDVVKGGWIVKNITNTKIIVSRNGQTMEITY